MQSRCTDLKYSVMHLEFGIEYVLRELEHIHVLWCIVMEYKPVE